MNKYRNVKTEVDGISFASKAEAARYLELKLLLRAGKISNLEMQPRFRIEVNGFPICTYIGDFQYVENGKTIIFDTKGMKTAVYRLKKKLMFAVHGIEVMEG